MLLLVVFYKAGIYFQCKIFQKVSLSSNQMFDNKLFFRLKTKLTVLPLIHVIFFLAFQIIPVRLKGARYNVGDKEVTHPLLLN